MDSTDKYARYIAAGEEGYAYVNTGTVHSGIVPYYIADGKFTFIGRWGGGESCTLLAQN